MSDGQLLDRFVARRDEAAFESLLRRHGPMVLRVCRDLLADPHEAEDAFQATFLVLVRNAGTIREGDSLGRWLHGVATRIAFRARAVGSRRQARERQGVDMARAVDGSASASGFDAARREVLPILHAELDRLPEKFRDAVILCYLQGHTCEEAARRLKCPLGTLKGRLTRAREILRGRLTRRGMAVSALLLLLLLAPEAKAELPEGLIGSTLRSARGASVGGLADPTLPERARSWALEELDAARPLLRLVLAGAALGAGALTLGLLAWFDSVSLRAGPLPRRSAAGRPIVVRGAIAPGPVSGPFLIGVPPGTGACVHVTKP